MGACGFIEKGSKRFFELLCDLNVSDTEIEYLTIIIPIAQWAGHVIK